MKATRRAKITALGRYVPPKVVTNYDLARRIDTNHDWVVERTGIVERHWVEPGTPTSELAAQAVGDLLKNRGIEASEIELIIVATVTPDMFFPATACIVQNKIRATRAWGRCRSGRRESASPCDRDRPSARTCTGSHHR